MELTDFSTQLEKVQKTFKKRTVKINQPVSEFPELHITVPDSWSQIQLAPLYDVHVGSPNFDEDLFLKHRDWIANTPNVLTFNGGDMIENITPIAAAKMGQTPKTPEEQLVDATELLAPIQHKMLFALPGNHEDRTFKAAGMSSAKRLADNMQVPFFSDYCFATIKWRGNNFRILAHHGAGGATTPGAQRNSARKELPWAKFDVYWTGHLHNALADIVFQTDFDQKTGMMYERNSVVMISPSYLKYFGGYAAKMRLAPGTRGLGVMLLNPNGRIDVSLHANGKRL